MIENPHKILDELKPEKEFFIGIDSDGCVFDTMEIKQKECFCPQFVKHFGLQRVSKYARETWEFVNLYSKTRGVNRFNALIRAIDLLGQREEVKLRNAKMPDLTPVIDWVEKESKLGNPALFKYAAEVNNPIISQTLNWSIEVNKEIEGVVFDIPPFPYVIESLEKMKSKADLMVVSQTPVDALKREWEEHNISGFVKLIAGQEYGTKSEHLKYAAKGKYPDNKILMIGDAPGDLKAAKSNGVLFYPINPGHEDVSWKKFYEEALDKFFNGTYEGDYENNLISEFEKYLPENPNWKVV
ncbi:MAG: HAD hydrolase-like protein [Ignavibacteriaceae bacterium]|jgi:phosphoglycolate phosphatase-like HAD superfamily hydrolase|nr:HAD hydrolase-like protein [Ignavibacteriaceae bacterium]